MAEAQERTRERLEKRDDFFDQLPLSTRQECQDATNRMNAIILPLVEKYSKLMGVRQGRKPNASVT